MFRSLIKLEKVLINRNKISLNISGMTCASCVQTIEKYVSNQDGVSNVKVNLLSEEAEIEFDPSIVSEKNLVDWVDDIGYKAEIKKISSPDSIQLDIQGMTCASCVVTIEKYIGSLDGVKNISVNLTTEKALVEFSSDIIGTRDLVEAVSDIGFTASIASEDVDIERLERKEEIKKWKRKLFYSTLLTIPVLLIAMFFPLWKLVQLQDFWI